MSRRRRSRHHARDTLLVVALAVLAVLSAVAWLMAHVLILAGTALIIGAAYYLGSLHERRRARPGQAQLRQDWPVAPLPAAAAAVPAATVPVPGTGSDWCEPGTRQQPSLRATSDKARLLADPRSGVRPLWRPS
jgi:hypothetical protein